MEHILVFKNKQTQYGVMHHFRESLCAAFMRKGVKVTLIDVNEARKSLLSMIYRNPPDCTFAFNGLRPMHDGRFIADILEIPHLAWLLDSAHYFHNLAHSRYNLIVSPDQTSCDLMRTWGSPHSYFLPHAFERTLVTEPGGKRPYPIVFLGSLMDYIPIEKIWTEALPKNVVRTLHESIDQVLATPSMTVQDGFNKVVEAHTHYFSALQENHQRKIATELD
jgi:spore maturation protein CgeB